MDNAAKLTEAINKLEAYAQEADKVATPSASKTIALMRTLLLSNFDVAPKKHKHQRHPPDKETVLRAVEFINRQRFYIEKLKEGTPAEQELAATVAKTIDDYNRSCDRRIHQCTNPEKGLANLFRSRKPHPDDIPPKISLPQKVTVHRHYTEGDTPTPSSAANTIASILIPRQSAELFQMKALSLLEHYGIATNPEARAHVKVSPIFAAAEPGSAMCTLTQTFTLFPGQTIVVKGHSSLDPKTLSIAKLFPETFCLSLESTQTGFPHPSQRAGWTLAHQLMPECPQRVDLLKTTAALFRKKAQAIGGLSPHGELLPKAKRLLSEKRHCFHNDHDRLIAMHKQLASAIEEAADVPSDETKQAIDTFFLTLARHPHPFERMAETNHQMREAFIARPHQKLVEAILKGKMTDLGSVNPEQRLLEARRVMSEAIDKTYDEFTDQAKAAASPDEKAKVEYIRNLGRSIGKAAMQIMLQYLSEDLIFEPPKLTPFERKVQAAVFNHLTDFLAELENEAAVVSIENLEEAIQNDITTFKGDATFAICQELADYFDARYLSLID